MEPVEMATVCFICIFRFVLRYLLRVTEVILGLPHLFVLLIIISLPTTADGTVADGSAGSRSRVFGFPLVC